MGTFLPQDAERRDILTTRPVNTLTKKMFGDPLRLPPQIELDPPDVDRATSLRWRPA